MTTKQTTTIATICLQLEYLALAQPGIERTLIRDIVLRLRTMDGDTTVPLESSDSGWSQWHW